MAATTKARPDYSWYPEFVKWWAANVRDAQSAATGRAIYAQKIQESQQAVIDSENEEKLSKQEKKQDSLRQAGNIALGVGAVGAPIAADLGGEISGLLGLGDAASKATGAGTSGASSILGNLSPVNMPSAQSTGFAADAASSVGTAGAEAAGTGFLDTGGLLGEGSMTASQYIPGAAGLYGAYDLLNRDQSKGRGLAQGAASGAGIGFTLGGLPGAAIGGGIGGLLGLGESFFGSKERFKDEYKRKKKLYDQGVISAQQLGEEPTQGRSRDELVAIEQAKGPQGNVEFARSRKESSLRPEDIQGYARILEKASQDKIDPYTLSKAALDAGAVREHHGTVDVDWSKVNPASYSAPVDMSAPAAPTGLMALGGDRVARSNTISPGIDLQGRRIPQLKRRR